MTEQHQIIVMLAAIASCAIGMGIMIYNIYNYGVEVHAELRQERRKMVENNTRI